MRIGYKDAEENNNLKPLDLRKNVHQQEAKKRAGDEGLSVIRRVIKIINQRITWLLISLRGD